MVMYYIGVLTEYENDMGMGKMMNEKSLVYVVRTLYGL